MIPLICRLSTCVSVFSFCRAVLDGVQHTVEAVEAVQIGATCSATICSESSASRRITNWSASFDEYRRDTYRIGSGQVNNGAVLLLAL